MTEVRDALIVAGGAGTRLAPLTLSIPKPLLPFCGAPFLEGVVRRLAAVGITRVWLIVGADVSPFAALVGAGARHGVDVRLVAEPEPLGTAGGVRSVLDRLDATFLVLNGDILTDIDLTALIDAHRTSGARATLALVEVEDTSTFGVCVREGTRIVDFVEKPPAGTLADQRAVNAGTYVLEPSALADFPLGPLSFELTVFPTLVRSGAHVEGHVGAGVWADLGTCERFLAGHRLALDGALAWPTLDDLPERAPGERVAADAIVDAGARVRPPVLVGPGARVEAGAVIGPHAVIGADTVVAAGARVVDATLLDEVVVGADVVLDGVLVGPRARIEPGALVAPGTIVAADARVVGRSPGARPGTATVGP
jgi:NDP-sugar pyrophosphorylase family protein